MYPRANTHIIETLEGPGLISLINLIQARDGGLKHLFDGTVRTLVSNNDVLVLFRYDDDEGTLWLTINRQDSIRVDLTEADAVINDHVINMGGIPDDAQSALWACQSAFMVMKIVGNAAAMHLPDPDVDDGPFNAIAMKDAVTDPTAGREEKALKLDREDIEEEEIFDDEGKLIAKRVKLPEHISPEQLVGMVLDDLGDQIEASILGAPMPEPGDQNYFTGTATVVFGWETADDGVGEQWRLRVAGHYDCQPGTTSPLFDGFVPA